MSRMHADVTKALDLIVDHTNGISKVLPLDKAMREVRQTAVPLKISDDEIIGIIIHYANRVGATILFERDQVFD